MDEKDQEIVRPPGDHEPLEGAPALGISLFHLSHTSVQPLPTRAGQDPDSITCQSTSTSYSYFLVVYFGSVSCRKTSQSKRRTVVGGFNQPSSRWKRSASSPAGHGGRKRRHLWEFPAQSAAFRPWRWDSSSEIVNGSERLGYRVWSVS